MMHFLVAPDFPPEFLAGWHLLNTYLQRKCNCDMHLYTPHSSQEQYQILKQGHIDVIYANPFDAAKLVRHVGYLPAVKPVDKADEMVIATAADSPIKGVTDIKKGMTVALTKNHDVKLIGLRLLEAVDVGDADLTWKVLPSFQAVAKAAINKEVDLAFFVQSSYYTMNRLTLDRLHTVIESKLKDIQHLVLMHPRNRKNIPFFQQVMCSMKDTPQGQQILDELGIPKGFEILENEDCEFLIDLMETLLD